MSRHLMLTIKIPIPTSLNQDAAKLNKFSGRIYSKTLSFVRRIHRKKNFWLSQNTVQKYILRWASDIPMHTHSKQAMVQQYFNALKGYIASKKSSGDARPPFRTKKYMPTVWKASAIRIKGTRLVLSNGSGTEPFVVPLPRTLVDWINNAHIRLAKLVWDFRNRRYYIHLSMEVDGRSFESNEKVVAVDLGVIHPIAAFDGKEVRIRKLRNQLDDILHKITSNFVAWAAQRKASKIVIGDVTGIRERVNYNKVANQKIHG